MHRSSPFIFVAIVALRASLAFGDDPNRYTTEYLWPSGAPLALGSDEVDRPKLMVYLPQRDKANGAGVLVIPGGGYHGLAIDHEGHEVAEWLNAKGVAAFVLTYRLGPKYHHPAMLLDAQRGIRTIRARADEWGVKRDKLGVMGFSAGGHLASTLATHYDEVHAEPADAIDSQSARPDFAVLCYPVISMRETYTHAGSRTNLLGEKPDAALVQNLSNDTRVTSQTPPTFIFQTNDDVVVPAENAVAFYLALRKAKVPAELHVFEPGKHGVGLAQQQGDLAIWPELLLNWLVLHGMLDRQ